MYPHCTGDRRFLRKADFASATRYNRTQSHDLSRLSRGRRIRFCPGRQPDISMKLRVGIVGLGEAWETRHRPALRALSDRFEVRAVCCEVAHLAHQAARDFHVQHVDGFRALAARDDVDAVLILSPEWYGPLPVLAACDNGKSGLLRGRAGHCRSGGGPATSSAGGRSGHRLHGRISPPPGAGDAPPEGADRHAAGQSRSCSSAIAAPRSSPARRKSAAAAIAPRCSAR